MGVVGGVGCGRGPGTGRQVPTRDLPTASAQLRWRIRSSRQSEQCRVVDLWGGVI